MKAIVVVDRNWGIGKNNDLLFRLTEDMKFFRRTTTGKVIVMGSNTLKSFPQGKPLPNRINVVLYPGGEKREDCLICDDMEELKKVLAKYPPEDIFVVGGAMFYKTMLPYCDTVYVTKADADGEATVFYENLDKMPNWRLIKQSDKVLDNGYEIMFCEYKNDKPVDFFGGTDK